MTEEQEEKMLKDIRKIEVYTYAIEASLKETVDLLGHLRTILLLPFFGLIGWGFASAVFYFIDKWEVF